MNDIQCFSATGNFWYADFDSESDNGKPDNWTITDWLYFDSLTAKKSHISDLQSFKIKAEVSFSTRRQLWDIQLTKLKKKLKLIVG